MNDNVRIKATPKDLADLLKNMKRENIPQLEQELLREGMRTRDKIVQLTPVDTGLLRTENWGEVKSEGNKVTLTHLNNKIYAAVQHENMDFNHTVGQAKYVEEPFLEALPRYYDTILKIALGGFNDGKV